MATNPERADQIVHVRSGRLRGLIARLFAARGVPGADAETMAEVLVEADLRGVESHGSTRVAGYCSMIRRGLLNPKPDVRVVRDTPTLAMLEGDGASGIIVALPAMQIAMDLSAADGLGCGIDRVRHHYLLTWFSI